MYHIYSKLWGWSDARVQFQDDGYVRGKDVCEVFINLLKRLRMNVSCWCVQISPPEYTQCVVGPGVRTQNNTLLDRNSPWSLNLRCFWLVDTLREWAGDWLEPLRSLVGRDLWSRLLLDKDPLPSNWRRDTQQGIVGRRLDQSQTGQFGYLTSLETILQGFDEARLAVPPPQFQSLC